MHIWANPAIESITVLTELLGAWVFYHVSIRKPARRCQQHPLFDEVVDKFLTMPCIQRIHWTLVCPHILKQALSLSNERHPNQSQHRQ